MCVCVCVCVCGVCVCLFVYCRKYPNLVCTSYFSGNLEEKKIRIALEFIFLVSQKFVIYKILNTLKLFWFTFNLSVLLNKGVQSFIHDI